MIKVVHTRPSNYKTGTAAGSQYQQNNVDPGTHKVLLPVLTSAKWSKNRIDINDTVSLSVFCQGLENGSIVRFEIYEQDIGGTPQHFDLAEGKVNGTKAVANWKFRKDL
ncbi:MAG: hypothetical protein PHC61_13495, partial [Chitinivibrionales bacterium]|nr:hypothetical protein [Chitinivibrionales bacterium]